MAESNNPNTNFAIIAYSVFLAVIVYAWNPIDAEGNARLFSAIMIIVVASILGSIRRAVLGIDLNESVGSSKSSSTSIPVQPEEDSRIRDAVVEGGMPYQEAVQREYGTWDGRSRYE